MPRAGSAAVEADPYGQTALAGYADDTGWLD
jgi:hypothetical protein